jgi:hypothetical protein
VECLAAIEGDHLQTLRAKNGNFSVRRYSGGLDLSGHTFFLRTAAAQPANPSSEQCESAGQVAEIHTVRKRSEALALLGRDQTLVPEILRARLAAGRITGGKVFTGKTYSTGWKLGQCRTVARLLPSSDRELHWCPVSVSRFGPLCDIYGLNPSTVCFL